MTDFSDPMTHMEQLAVDLLRSAVKRDVDGVASHALDIKILAKSMEIDAKAAAADLERRRLARIGFDGRPADDS